MLLENTKYLYSYIKWFLQFKQALFSIHIILLMLHNLHKIISTIYAFMQTVVSINIIHWCWSWKCSKDIWLETILTTVLIFICCTELRFFVYFLQSNYMYIKFCIMDISSHIFLSSWLYCYESRFEVFQEFFNLLKQLKLWNI